MEKNVVKQMIKVASLNLEKEGQRRLTVRRKSIWEDFKDELFKRNRVTPSSRIKVVFSGEPCRNLTKNLYMIAKNPLMCYAKSHCCFLFHIDGMIFKMGIKLLLVFSHSCKIYFPLMCRSHEWENTSKSLISVLKIIPSM